MFLGLKPLWSALLNFLRLSLTRRLAARTALSLSSPRPPPPLPPPSHAPRQSPPRLAHIRHDDGANRRRQHQRPHPARHLGRHAVVLGARATSLGGREGVCIEREGLAGLLQLRMELGGGRCPVEDGVIDEVATVPAASGGRRGGGGKGGERGRGSEVLSLIHI